MHHGCPGFFYRSFERKYYWFEAVDMLRKFILVAGMALAEQGTTTQLMTAQLVCFAYVVLVVHTKPYKKDAADFTNMASGPLCVGSACRFGVWWRRGCFRAWSSPWRGATAHDVTPLDGATHFHCVCRT